MFDIRFARWFLVLSMASLFGCSEEFGEAGFLSELEDASVPPSLDAAVVTPVPSEEPLPVEPNEVLDGGSAPVDAGSMVEPVEIDAGLTTASGTCFRARRLWHEDFETGNYARWSGTTYGNTSVGCARSGFSTVRSRSGSRSHRTSISCTANQSHRVYSGVQFNGDTPLARYTNRGSGIDAPYGIVNTYWHWLDVPYSFGNGRWFSPFTVNNSCDWSDRVITLGLENASNRLTPAHLTGTGGTMSFATNAPSFPLRRWVRTTVYINYYDGVMHVWQDGQKVAQGTFSRRSRQICQFHWGLYASANNGNIVLFEDDISIWKLNQRWTNFNVEPYFGGNTTVCAN